MRLKYTALKLYLNYNVCFVLKQGVIVPLAITKISPHSIHLLHNQVQSAFLGKQHII